jgi:hypothetical protein
MSENLSIKNLIKTLENTIEEKFSSHPAYQQTKAVLEGKAKQVDVKVLVDDSRAMFAGSNKPQALFTAAVDHLKTRLVQNADTFKKDIEERKLKLSEGITEAKKIVAGFALKKEEELAARGIEEKELSALRVVAEAKKAEAELKQHTASVEKSVKNITEKLDGLKTIFVPKGS